MDLSPTKTSTKKNFINLNIFKHGWMLKEEGGWVVIKRFLSSPEKCLCERFVGVHVRHKPQNNCTQPQWNHEYELKIESHKFMKEDKIFFLTVIKLMRWYKIGIPLLRYVLASATAVSQFLKKDKLCVYPQSWPKNFSVLTNIIFLLLLHPLK